ncbi:Histidine-containing phosphotransfer protein 4 [Bienertia sinuspersici]
MSVKTCVPLHKSRMNPQSLQEQIVQLRRSLFDEGHLDEQFLQLEELQDDANPDFVEEIVTSYYTDSVRLIQNIDRALDQYPLDFEKLDNYMHQFKGSSSSIGAKKVVHECLQFRKYCAAGNAEGCVKSFQMIKQEQAMLRKKLEAYFQLLSSARGT